MLKIFEIILKKVFFSKFLKFFCLISQKFGQSATSHVKAECFFFCLFWAAGGFIDFLIEGISNLYPPFNALFNSRPD
jgi:hypothetical protein